MSRVILPWFDWPPRRVPGYFTPAGRACRAGNRPPLVGQVHLKREGPACQRLHIQSRAAEVSTETKVDYLYEKTLAGSVAGVRRPGRRGSFGQDRVESRRELHRLERLGAARDPVDHVVARMTSPAKSVLPMA